MVLNFDFSLDEDDEDNNKREKERERKNVAERAKERRLTSGQATDSDAGARIV